MNMKRSWLNWRTFVVIAIGLVVAGPLLRELVSVVRLPNSAAERGAPAPAESQAPSTPTTAPARNSSVKAPKTSTISVNGQSIPSAGQPTILLNPGLVRPGTKVAVSGFGFDPGSIVDVVLKKSASDAGTAVTLAKADETGSFGTTFIVPSNMGARSPTVLAQERNSNKVAQTKTLMPGTRAHGKMGTAHGKPGSQ